MVVASFLDTQMCIPRYKNLISLIVESQVVKFVAGLLKSARPYHELLIS